MTGFSEPPLNLTVDVQLTPICGEESVAVIELMLKLLWGLTADEHRPPKVILD